MTITFFSVLHCETLHIIYHLFNFSVNCWSMLLEIIFNYSPQQSNCELTKKCEKGWRMNSVFLLLACIYFTPKHCVYFSARQSSLRRHASSLNDFFYKYNKEWRMIHRRKQAHNCVQKLYICMLLYIPFWVYISGMWFNKRTKKKTHLSGSHHVHKSA